MPSLISVTRPIVWKALAQGLSLIYQPDDLKQFFETTKYITLFDGWGDQLPLADANLAKALKDNFSGTPYELNMTSSQIKSLSEHVRGETDENQNKIKHFHLGIAENILTHP